jgi:hypothetical protein
MFIVDVFFTGGQLRVSAIMHAPCLYGGYSYCWGHVKGAIRHFEFEGDACVA